MTEPTDPSPAPTTPLGMAEQLVADLGDETKEDPVLAALRVVQSKPGVRTSEFWLALILVVAGLAMQAWPGHEGTGATIALIAALLYKLSRVAVKVEAIKGATQVAAVLAANPGPVRVS